VILGLSAPIWPRLSVAPSYRGQFEERLKAVMNEIAQNKNSHPVHRRAAYARRSRSGRRRDPTPATCSSPRSRAASCSAWARRHSNEYRKYNREGWRAGAALPDRDRRAADHRRDGRDPQGTSQEVEDHHRVTIPDTTLVAASKLSEQLHTPTGSWPGQKAIDVIDEAGARRGWLRRATRRPRRRSRRSSRKTCREGAAVRRPELQRAAITSGTRNATPSPTSGARRRVEQGR